MTAYAAIQAGEFLALAMQYVNGKDLAVVVKYHGPLPVRVACLYAKQVALGLQHAHEKQMMHRDIKPSNLMLVRDGEKSQKHTVKILDFGLVKSPGAVDCSILGTANSVSTDGNLTGVGRMLGTPDYMAPEQITNATAAKITADIYSLGGTLYFLLTGRPPFQAATVQELFRLHQTVVPPLLNRKRADVPPELAAVVARMLAKDPAQRYQTPGEVAQALTPFIMQRGNAPTSGTTVVSETTVPPEPASEPVEESEAPPLDVPKPVADREVVLAALRRRRANVRLRRKIGIAIACVMLLVGIVGRWGNVRIPSTPIDAEVAIAPVAVVVPKVETPIVELPQPEPPKPTPEVPAPKPDDGFVPLFNEKDLTGWEMHPDAPGNWKVVSGHLVGSGPGVSYLFTKRADFGNVHIRGRMRVNEGGNSGLFARKPFNLDWNSGYQIEMYSRYGRPPDIGQLIGFHSQHTSKAGPVRPDEWYDVDYRLEGDKHTVRINNEITADITDSRAVPRQGRIALEMMGEYTRIEISKLEVKELAPSLGSTPNVVPPVVPSATTVDGFVSLFNGKDLTGWTTHPSQPSGWDVRNGSLIGTGRDLSYLFTERGDYRNYHLRTRVKINPNGDSGIAVRCENHPPPQVGGTIWYPSGYEVAIFGGTNPGGATGAIFGSDTKGMAQSVGKPHEPEEFFDYDVIAIGNSIQTRVNGKDVASYEDTTASATNRATGHIGLQILRRDSAVEFTSIQIRELPANTLTPFQIIPKEKAARLATVVRGQWTRDGDELVVKKGTGFDVAYLTFGDTTWTDYDLEFQAMRLDVSGVYCNFGGIVGYRDARNMLVYMAGRGWANNRTGHHLEVVENGSWKDHPRNLVNMRRDVWYTVRIRVRGSKLTAFLDRAQVYDFTHSKRIVGCVGLSTTFDMNYRVRFKDVRVTAADGTLLWTGIPELPSK